jgi:polysaccharide export outer membrane protein
MLLLVFVAVLLTACEGFYGGKTSMNSLKPDGSTTADPVTLAPGDSLKISFPGAPEYNSTQKITIDGNISLPFVGEVHAAGKRIGQLQSNLSGMYEHQLQNSDVVVTLESAGTSIIISGGVRSPGKFNVDRPVTLLEAIFLAGGFNEFANRKKVRVIRVADGHYVTNTYDLAGAMHGKEASLVYLKGGDMIEVEERTW